MHAPADGPAAFRDIDADLGIGFPFGGNELPDFVFSVEITRIDECVVSVLIGDRCRYAKALGQDLAPIVSPSDRPMDPFNLSTPEGL